MTVLVALIITGTVHSLETTENVLMAHRPCAFEGGRRLAELSEHCRHYW